MEKKTILRLKPWAKETLEGIGSLAIFGLLVFCLMLISGTPL